MARRSKQTFEHRGDRAGTPLPACDADEAKDLLSEAGHDSVPGPGHDLDPPSERALSAIVKERFGHEFAFVTDYPTTVRPFYHMRHPRIGRP